MNARPPTHRPIRSAQPTSANLGGMSRRQFQVASMTLASAVWSGADVLGDESPVGAPFEEPFKLKYLVASSMYGCLPVKEIFPQVRSAGASAIDLWPRVHGNQREQLDELGMERFGELLDESEIRVGCLTQFRLSSVSKRDEMISEIKLAARLGADTIVTSGRGPTGLRGRELHAAVGAYIEGMRPTIEAAEEQGVRIAVENHANHLIESPDSLKCLAELSPSPALAIAFAPYHLEQDSQMLGRLVESLGNSIALFYAWQYGMGCKVRLPKEQELLQMPGRGSLDFSPMVTALQKIRFRGWTEIFMHPVPRGIPILATADEVTEEINRSRSYLDELLN